MSLFYHSFILYYFLRQSEARCDLLQFIIRVYLWGENWYKSIDSQYYASNFKLFPSFLFSSMKSPFFGSRIEVKYVNKSSVQLVHSIVVPMIYSLIKNESIKPSAP